MAGPLEILGKRFGKLTAVVELPRVKGKRFWRLRCDCGKHRDTLQSNFTSGGKMKSCGCDSRKQRNHGLSAIPEYRHWINMISRCENPGTPGFANYGERGISVDPEWRGSFESFYRDMGPRPSPSHSIDRIDVNGNYEPGNCRWATKTVQGRNTRSNRMVTIGGQRMTLAEAVERAPVTYNTVLYRLKRGWSVNDAVALERRQGLKPENP